MGNFLLGIDYGTGGTKATIINDQGEVLGFAFEEYPIITPHPGWSEHDPHRYWDAACRIIKKSINEAQINPKEIRGIALSSALPSMVMIDAEGNPVNNAYNLMDRRATEEVKWIKENIGEEKIFEITKNRLEDHPTLVNLMWEKKHRPEDYKRIRKVLTIDGYITYKLTGKYVCNYSAAAFYGVAYNLLEKKFDDEILSTIGIEREILPEKFYRCEEIIGEVTKNAAEQTGLSPGTPVCAGQVDCNAGWFGAGAIEPGDIQMNLGTCGNFGVILSKPEFLNTMINFSYTTDSENTYITVPTTTTGGQLIRYMRDTFSQAEMHFESVMGIDSYDILNLEAQKVPPGSEGLVVLPYLMGERTPIWDVNARGVIFGLSLNHTKGHVIRAMMESVAYALYDSFRIIKETGQKINFPIVLNEGGAKSILWRKIITDTFNVPTVLVKRRTGAPYGDALLAGVATGVFKDFSISREFTEYIDPIEPSEENHNLYMKYFKLYKKIYEHLKEDFKELVHLRELSIKYK
ncbi:MAG: carbohydrate kinase [Spirochaetes bacterium]|nr:MAG: carbohydrate kinase [Spirochaetota bacterium]